MPNKDAKGIQFDTVNNILNTPKKTVNDFLTARITTPPNLMLSQKELRKHQYKQKQAILSQNFRTFLQNLDQSNPKNLQLLDEIQSYYDKNGNYQIYTDAYNNYQETLQKQIEKAKEIQEIKKMIPDFIDDLNNEKLIINYDKYHIQLQRSYLKYA